MGLQPGGRHPSRFNRTPSPAHKRKRVRPADRTHPLISGEIQECSGGLLTAGRRPLRAGTIPAFGSAFTWGTAFALTFAALSFRTGPHDAEHFLAAQFAIAVLVQRFEGSRGSRNLLCGKLTVLIGIQSCYHRRHHAAARATRATGRAARAAGWWSRRSGWRRRSGGGILGFKENGRGHESEGKEEFFHEAGWFVGLLGCCSGRKSPAP